MSAISLSCFKSKEPFDYGIYNIVLNVFALFLGNIWGQVLWSVVARRSVIPIRPCSLCLRGGGGDISLI